MDTLYHLDVDLSSVASSGCFAVGVVIDNALDTDLKKYGAPFASTSGLSEVLVRKVESRTAPDFKPW